jgi:hypothetical protein
VRLPDQDDRIFYVRKRIEGTILSFARRLGQGNPKGARGKLARWQKHDHNSAIDQPNDAFERDELARILNNSANTPQNSLKSLQS